MAKKVIQDLRPLFEADMKRLAAEQKQQTQNSDSGDFQEGYTDKRTVFPLPKQSPLQQLTQPVKAHKPLGLQQIVEVSRTGNDAKPFVQPDDIVQAPGENEVNRARRSREADPFTQGLVGSLLGPVMPLTKGYEKPLVHNTPPTSSSTGSETVDKALSAVGSILGSLPAFGAAGKVVNGLKFLQGINNPILKTITSGAITFPLASAPENAIKTVTGQQSVGETAKKVGEEALFGALFSLLPKGTKLDATGVKAIKNTLGTIGAGTLGYTQSALDPNSTTEDNLINAGLLTVMHATGLIRPESEYYDKSFDPKQNPELDRIVTGLMNPENAQVKVQPSPLERLTKRQGPEGPAPPEAAQELNNNIIPMGQPAQKPVMPVEDIINNTQPVGVMDNAPVVQGDKVLQPENKIAPVQETPSPLQQLTQKPIYTEETKGAAYNNIKSLADQMKSQAPVDNNAEAIKNMLSRGKSAEDISKALRVPIEEVGKYVQVELQPKDTPELEQKPDLSNQNVRDTFTNEIQSKQDALLQARDNYEQAKGSGKRTALTEAKKIQSDLSRLGVKVDIVPNKGRLNIKVDGQTLKKEAVIRKPEDYPIFEENAKKTFEEMPDNGESQTAGIEALHENGLLEDISPLTEKKTQKAVEDIRQDSGKELSPEAQVLRQAYEKATKDGVEVSVTKNAGAQAKDFVSADQIQALRDTRLEERAKQTEEGDTSFEFGENVKQETAPNLDEELHNTYTQLQSAKAELEQAKGDLAVDPYTLARLTDKMKGAETPLDQLPPEAQNIYRLEEKVKALESKNNELLKQWVASQESSFKLTSGDKETTPRPKSEFGEQLSLGGETLKTQMPDKPLYEGKADKSNETPLFQQTGEVKGQEKMFEDKKEEPQTKQPYEMTQKEYVEYAQEQLRKSATVKGSKTGAITTNKALMNRAESEDFKNNLKLRHQADVEEALTAGKTVSPEVLADYPELQPNKPQAEPKSKPGTIEDVKFSKDDIPYETAYRAHTGTSFSPEKRAVSEQEDYVNHLTSVKEELSKLAKTDEEKALVKDEFIRYAENYKKRILDLLRSHSGIYSTMIAGPSNFPVRRMEKLNNAYDNKLKELNEWHEKAIGSIKKKLKGMEVEEAGGELAMMQQKLAKAKENHEKMKASNAIVNSKKLSPEEKIKKLTELGFSEQGAKTILQPDFMNRTGFPAYKLTNNLANIKRMEMRVKELAAKESKSGTEDVKEYEGAKIINNHDLQRVQIQFDSIPDVKTREDLKRRGFRWSPREGAWQRQNTNAGLYDAKSIIDSHFKAKEVKTEVPQAEEEPLTPSGLKKPYNPAILTNDGTVYFHEDATNHGDLINRLKDEKVIDNSFRFDDIKSSGALDKDGNFYDANNLKDLPTKEIGKNKRFISEEMYKKAGEDLRNKTSLSIASDFEGVNFNDLFRESKDIVKDFAVIGGYHLENLIRGGAVKAEALYNDWKKSMLDEFGKGIIPHLKTIWGEVQKDNNISGLYTTYINPNRKEEKSNTTVTPEGNLNQDKGNSVKDALFKALDGDNALSQKKLHDIARSIDKKVTPKEVKSIKDEWEKGKTENTPTVEEETTAPVKEEAIKPEVPKEKAPDATEDNPEWATGVKNATVNKERVERGKAPLETEGKREWGNVWEEAKTEISNGRSPKALAEIIIDGKKEAVTDTEIAILDHERVRLYNEHKRLTDKIVEAQTEGDMEKAAEFEAARKTVESDIDINDKAARTSGTSSARSLAIRRMMAKEDYTLARQVQKWKASHNGTITDEVRKRFEEYDKKIRDLENQIASRQDNESQKAAEEFMRKLEKEEKFQNRKERRVKAKEVLDKEYEGLVNEWAHASAETLNMGITYKQAQVLTKIAKNRFQAGFTTVEGLVDEIFHTVSAFAPDVTKREIRDAISGYGKTISMKQDELSKDLREWKRQAKLFSALEDAMKGQRPLRSGLQRDPVSDKVRLLQKEVKEEMKKNSLFNDIDTRTPEEKWKSALDAVKTRLKNEITDLNRQIETGEKPPKRTELKYDAEANQLKSERDRLKGLLDQLEDKTPSNGRTLTDEQKVKLAMRAVHKSINEYERRIKEQDLNPKKKESTTPETPELQDLRKKRDSLIKEFQTLQKASRPPKDLDAIAIKSYKTRLNNRIREVERRIKEQDFKPKEKKETPTDPEIARLQGELKRAKARYDFEFRMDELKNRTKMQKFKDATIEIMNLPRSAFMTVGDLSATLRQGLLLTVKHPIMATQAEGASIKAMFSEKAFNAIDDAIQFSPNKDSYDNHGLYLAKTRDATLELTKREEAFMSNLAERIPVWGHVVKGSERAYITYLNKMRADVYDRMKEGLESQGIADVPKNKKIYDDLARFINNSTGRGDLGRTLEGIAPLLNGVFFSPRNIAAKIQTLNPMYYAKLSKPIRIEALKSMGALAIAGTTILALAKLAGAKVEPDPISSDSEKIRINNTRIDIWGGYQPFFRYFAQMLTGKMKSTTTGKTTELNGKKFPFTSRWDLTGRFLEQKVSPQVSLLINALRGKDMIGKEFDIEDEAVKRAIPMIINDTYEAVKDLGPIGGAATLPASILGAGVQTYAPKEKTTLKRRIYN